MSIKHKNNNKNDQLATYHKRQGGITNKKVQLPKKSHSCKVTLFREQDSNLRPLAYETNKLPTAPPRYVLL